MSISTIATEIINGKRLTKNQDLHIFETCDLQELTEGADRIRRAFIGNDVDLCSIINGRSGACPEDCKYCAQSVHHHTGCEIYSFLDEETIETACKKSNDLGLEHFAIVTAGRKMEGEEFEKALQVYQTLSKKYNISLCASMGFLDREQIRRLKKAGVTRYHHNIETSEGFFKNICTTHTFKDKLHTISMLKEEGMQVCSGGIIGMGETFMDRVDMALTLSELQVQSIPINTLIPIPGTPLENNKPLTENEILRTVAMFRYINPTAHIRLAAGRALLTEDGKTAFESGASATITGDMLTTTCHATIKSDLEMFKGMGRTHKRG
ncbi:MAG: biotin synthase BioB [Lachnospiraceae bacterium]|nr:biotin synthase BioB [Lachnospiraceae bacterium]